MCVTSYLLSLKLFLEGVAHQGLFRYWIAIYKPALMRLRRLSTTNPLDCSMSTNKTLEEVLRLFSSFVAFYECHTVPLVSGLHTSEKLGDQ